MTAPTLTIEQLEALAAQAENDNDAEQARLTRLCKAMARILAARQPEAFQPCATSITDEAGHWDNSYPPKAEYHCHHGAPRLLKARRYDFEDVPTEGGYYHAWRRQTTNRGCYVAPDGALWGCDASGTGRVGQYAAYPGDCERAITLDWERIEPTLEDLREAEQALREKMAEFLNGEAA